MQLYNGDCLEVMKSIPNKSIDLILCDLPYNTELYGYMKQEISGGGETDRYPRSIITFASDKQTCHLHPTQKPVTLLEYFIKTYTNEEMLVLDNCMGSGSTGIACINTNRNFIGIELDKQYFDIAKERLTSYKKCND